MDHFVNPAKYGSRGLASQPELTGAAPPRPVILATAAAVFFGTALYRLDRGARYALSETL